MKLRELILPCALVATMVAAIPSTVLAGTCYCSATEYDTALEGTTAEAAFYSVQLLNQGGGNYNIHVFDQTYDDAAYGSIVVTDCTTGAILHSQNFDSSYGDFDNPGSADFPIVIGAAYFQVTLTTQEFSASSLFFGNDQVYVGNPPTSQLNSQTRCYQQAVSHCDCPTYASAAALGGSVQGVAFYSIQLLNLGGGNYNIHVFDRTYDDAAFGSVVVTDCATGAVIVNESFNSNIGTYDTPGSVDFPVVINAANFTVTLTALEFSASSLFFGNSQVYLGNPPTSQLNTQTRCYSAGDPPVPVQSATWGELKAKF